MLFTRVDLIFAVHNLAKFSSNPGIVNFELLVHLFGFIRDNNKLGFKYYYGIKGAPLSDLFRQASINTENQFLDFSGSSCKYCPDTGKITGACIIFYKSVPIDHGTHVLVPVAQ